MTLQAIIVDDEPAGRDLLAEMLSRRPDIQLIGSFGDSRAAVAAIKRQKPDILFLDVQMPGRDGFAVLDSLAAPLPAVVFVTAHDEYAVQAFEVAAVDYVLKPVAEHRLSQAIDRVISRVAAADAEPNATAITHLLNEMRQQRGDYIEYIPVREAERVKLLRVEEVSVFEASGQYVRLFVGKANFAIRQSMTALEAQLHPAKFLRVSRSAIVNVAHIHHLDSWSHGEWMLTLRNGSTVTSTRGYRQGLKKLLRRP
jgi:two-component system LytT family response regulator